VLKGGILLYLTGKGPSTRPTIDIDMLARSLPSDLLDKALVEIALATIALTEEFAQSPIQNRIWNQFLNRERLEAPGLPEVMVEFRRFMGPIHQALFNANPHDLIWSLATRTWG